jgi:hypothetical protein
MRSSSLIACQRVPRRWPVRRIRPAASSSRSRLSTCSRLALVCSARTDVVSPPFSDSSDSRRSAGLVFNARLGLGPDDLRARVGRRGTGSSEVSADTPRPDCDEAGRMDFARVAGAPTDDLPAGGISRPWSAERAASSVLISPFSSRSRASMESTICWVVLTHLMLRACAALPRTVQQVAGWPHSLSARGWPPVRTAGPGRAVCGHIPVRGS